MHLVNFSDTKTDGTILEEAPRSSVIGWASLGLLGGLLGLFLVLDVITFIEGLHKSSGKYAPTTKNKPKGKKPHSKYRIANAFKK